MKAVIMAGGLPSIVEDRYEPVPKPMAEIAGRPILWHIMKGYAEYGINEFIICTGYKGEYIKDYFMNYYMYQSDITVDLRKNEVQVHKKRTEDWKVTIVDTGNNSSIAQRLLMIKEFVGEEDFLVTYGDCVSDINIRKLMEQHRKGDKAVTMAVASPTGRNKILPISGSGELEEGDIQEHKFVCADACTMVFSSQVFKYLLMFKKEDVMSENLRRKLTRDGEIQIYLHEGFWSPMETARDKKYLDSLYENGQAPWKNWK